MGRVPRPGDRQGAFQHLKSQEDGTLEIVAMFEGASKEALPTSVR
jgi:hypothetical protein